MTKIITFKSKDKDKEINFKVFARSVAEGKIDEATRTLRDLIKCDFEEAQKITLHFKEKYETSPNIIMQMMMIKSQLENGQQNDALMAIQEILGVTGPMSLRILEAMKNQIQ